MDIKTLTGYSRAKITFYPPPVKSKEHIGSANVKLFQRTGSTALKVGSRLHVGILEIIAVGLF